MTADARERRDKIEAADSSFKAVSLEDIFELLRNRQEIEPLRHLASRYMHLGSLTDEALLVTPEGLFIAAKEVDDQTKLPTRVLVFPAKGEGHAPSIVADLLSGNAYAAGLPCQQADPRNATLPATVISVATEPTVTEVVGSSADFEYQLPASPRFFVGRGPRVEDLDRLVRGMQQPEGRAQVVVFNAQSGWGKSSLALKLGDMVAELSGARVCIDCRTAVHPIFVAASIRKALNVAEGAKLLQVPSNASYASVTACIDTLRRTEFSNPRRPVLVFFDQFENVFRNRGLTREFRDLAFGLSDLKAPFLLGFAWKTDLLAFTEGHPYQYRDDIRARAIVYDLEPFGAAEIGSLITRLQKACGQRIHRDLRERIREYSQGLPWLFKKLANHIQKELLKGVTQAQLISEVLNIQSLFESDLRGLTPAERQALTGIARSAPILASDAVDLSGGPEVVQTLLNQRLLVQVGERLDLYWDIFRDYLTTGSVPLRESYILRLTPNGVAKFLQALKASEGVANVEDLAAVMRTSKTAVLNAARDLRLLGILAVSDGPLRLNDQIVQAADQNAAIRARVALSLRRHQAFDLVTNLAASTSSVEVTQFEKVLPRQYPAVYASAKTWGNYARAFAYWFQFAGLAALDRDKLTPGSDQGLQIDLFAARRGINRARSAVVFPRCCAGPVLKLLDALAAHGSVPIAEARSGGDAMLIGLVKREGGALTLTSVGDAFVRASPPERQQLLRSVLDREPSFAIAASMILAEPGAKPLAIGRAVAERHGLAWKDGTAVGAGKQLRSWCRAVGMKTSP